jgi:molecular chaperone GrpE
MNDHTPETPANENAEAVQPDPVAELTRANAELAKANGELKDQLLRALAEMENLRKRTEREVADMRVYGIATFAREVLAVADNIRRALDATGPDWKATADPNAQALFDGVELTERELLKVLEKHGIRRIEPQGQKFDPNLHQAVFEIEDASVPAGTVLQVLQAGFTIGERILRPAMVGVAKGGPKAAAAPTETQSSK